jgi:hypothetical protein
VPEELLQKFLRVQNGADIRGVVLEGASREPVMKDALCKCSDCDGISTGAECALPVGSKVGVPAIALRDLARTDRAPLPFAHAPAAAPRVQASRTRAST